MGRQQVNKSRVQHTRIWVVMAAKATGMVASRAQCKAWCSSEMTLPEDTTIQRLHGGRGACSLPGRSSGRSSTKARRA